MAVHMCLCVCVYSTHIYITMGNMELYTLNSILTLEAMNKTQTKGESHHPHI